MIKRIETQATSKQDIAREFVYSLNRFLQLDPTAMSRLLGFHVPANQYFKKSPVIQLTEKDKVGMLGIINGLLGKTKSGRGLITLVTNNAGNPVRFELTLK